VIDLPKAYKSGALKRKSATTTKSSSKTSNDIFDYDDVMAVEVFTFRQNLINFAGWLINMKFIHLFIQ
jgi:hypothetical protein